MMETIVWIAVAIATFVAIWLADPYHRRLIDSRPKVGIKSDGYM